MIIIRFGSFGVASGWGCMTRSPERAKCLCSGGCHSLYPLRRPQQRKNTRDGERGSRSHPRRPAFGSGHQLTGQAAAGVEGPALLMRVGSTLAGLVQMVKARNGIPVRCCSGYKVETASRFDVVAATEDGGLFPVRPWLEILSSLLSFLRFRGSSFQSRGRTAMSVMSSRRGPRGRMRP
jgi:hypothetical protein